MKITGQLDPEDHVKAYRVHRRMTPVDRAIVIFSALSVLNVLAQFWVRGVDRLLFGGIAAAACAALSILVDRRWIPKKVRQQHESDTPREVEISADGIAIVTPKGTESQSWLRTAKYKIGKELVLLYGYDAKYLIFPNRWFTPDQKAEFDGYLRSELGEPAK
jgi:hypothetical protein